MNFPRVIRTGVQVFALALAASTAGAATIQIVNKDAAGEGFNDPTVVAPIGGNPGTTRGAQRLNVFNQAAAIWGALLPGGVTIKVDSYFDPLLCDVNGAVLGSTAPFSALRDFQGAVWPGTWYVIALANQLRGVDQDVPNSDMTARFNSSLDNVSCLGAVGWYYGYDHAHETDVDLLATVLHELGHGLGFVSLVDPSTGQYAGYPGDPHTDAFTRFLYDDTQVKYWDQLTPAQRAASALNTGKLVWRGDSTTTRAPQYLGPLTVVRFSGTGGFTGDKDYGTADFGPPLGSPTITAAVVYVSDGAAPTGDGCSSPFTNAAALAGKIALIDRGSCAFTNKTLNAQANGAIAVIVANNVASPPLFNMTGDGTGITIPTVSITQADGNAIKAALGSGTVIATLGSLPPQLQGADATGWVRMYAPNPLEPGSSVSHFDTVCFPDLLMEPSITPNLTSDVDLTKYVFKDMGWFPSLVPTIITQLYAEPDEDGLRIRWEIGDPGAFASLTLERSDNLVGPWIEIPADRPADGNAMVVVDRTVTMGRTYWYRVVGITPAGARAVFGPIQAQAVDAVRSFALSPASPNPSPGPFTVDFAVPRQTRVHLGLHDVLGRELVVLADGDYPAGRFRAQWDGAGNHGQVPVGVYFLRYAAAGQTLTRSIVITR